MRSSGARALAVCSVVCLAFVIASLPSRAQDAVSDLRGLHQLAVLATVRIQTTTDGGTGWLLQQNGPRPIVITNRHVVERGVRSVRVTHYLGSDGSTAETPAVVQWLSPDIDLAIVRLEGDPPPSARALTLEPGDIVRGQRVILGGQPNGLPFQTTEGVVTGHVPDSRFTGPCGRGRNCVVVDAASFNGSSGGPVLNTHGRVVGMLWGGDGSLATTTSHVRLPIWLENPTFAFLIHVRTIEGELRAYGESIRERRTR